MLQGVPAHADEADAFNLNATVSMMQDNNLFRLAPSVNASALGLDGKSDTITSTTLDLNLNKQFSLQRIVANVVVVDNRYQKNDYLDFTALNYDAKWLWAVGLRWTGELSAERKEGLNSFADYRNILQRNIRTTETERFTANYWFHSSWAAVAGVYRTSLSNEQPFLADSDYTGTGYNIGLRFRPVSGNTLTARASRLDGSYTKRQPNAAALYDSGFTEDNYGFDLDWRLTGQSLVRGKLSYLDRQHDNFSARDYSGWVGNLDYTYAYTGKGSVSIGFRHDLSPFQQPTSSYYVLDELNLSGQWAATSQITAIARLGYGQRAYEGAIVALPAGLDMRKDLYSRLGFDLSYQPARWLNFKAGVALENRNANYDVNDYKDRIGFISASAQY